MLRYVSNRSSTACDQIVRQYKAIRSSEWFRSTQSAIMNVFFTKAIIILIIGSAAADQCRDDQIWESRNCNTVCAELPQQKWNCNRQFFVKPAPRCQCIEGLAELSNGECVQQCDERCIGEQTGGYRQANECSGECELSCSGPATQLNYHILQKRLASTRPKNGNRKIAATVALRIRSRARKIAI